MTARSDAPGHSADEGLLRSSFGEPFVEWVLNGPGDPLTDEQIEVVRFLADVTRTHGAEHPDWPSTNALAPLLGFVDGRSGIQQLRIHAGGSLPDQPPTTGDEFLDAVIATAVDVYPETLLLQRDPFASLYGSYTSPNGRRAAELAATEPMMRVPEGVEAPQGSVQVLRSTGQGGGLQPLGIAPSLISAAWETSRLNYEVPTLEQVVAELPQLLSNARAAFQQKPATVTGLASLTGVLLPDGTILDLGWGRLRVAEERHHPEFIRRTLAQQRTTRKENSREITISDAGDVLLEVDLPYEVYVGEYDLSTGEWPTLKSQDLLEGRLVQVRLAYVLSALDHDPAIILPAWRRFIEPVTQGSSVSYSDPSRFAGRQPTQLDDEAAVRWQAWIERLNDVPMRRLGVAPTRLLRALAERLDPHDALIDAVIAWESLFASDTEAVLRVSASMARLLHPAGPERNRAKTELAKVYRLRSQVVHGNEVAPKEAYNASRTAITSCIEVLRKLVTERVDLVPMPAAERSTKILLE